MTRIFIAACAALCSAAASASTPGVRLDGDKAFIGYRDLDLSSIQGRDTLVNRIKAGASRVCQPEEFVYPYRANRKCLRTATASGVAQMDAVLTASTAR